MKPSEAEAVEVQTGRARERIPEPPAAWVDALAPGVDPDVSEIERMLGVKRDSEVWQLRLNKLIQMAEAKRTDLYVCSIGGRMRVLTADEALSHNQRAFEGGYRRSLGALKRFATRIHPAQLSHENRARYDVLRSYYQAQRIAIERDMRNLAQLPHGGVTEIDPLDG